MKKQILTELFYGHLLEVTIVGHETKIEFIPDEVKAEVFELLETNLTEGTFAVNDHNEEQISGSWRILYLHHDVLYRVLLWEYNESVENFISVDAFSDAFGNTLGRHYFEKWEHTYKRDIRQMIWYFGTDNDNGQKFLAMLQTQIEKYENRKNERKHDNHT